jgi:ADP-ribosylglycohydrolase
LSYAIYYFVVGNSYKESLTQVLRLKGDTDTNACIAGGLFGAYYGYNKL